MNVKVKRLDPAATLPTYGTEFSAGADLYTKAGSETVVPPHATVFFPLGFALEIPEGTVGLVYARSGLACKKGLAPANKVGVIDADYRGEITVAIHNHTDMPVTVTGGERIAQLVITPFFHADFEECDTLSDTARGAGGFGSTGTH